MENPFSIRRICATSIVSILFVSSTVMAAAKPVLYGPSQAVVGDLVQLNGQHFAAGASFTVKTTVGKKTTQELVSSGSDGSLSYQLVTSSAGKYQLQVRDSSNRLIATSIVLVHPAGE
ncbi:hypothetical protein [Rheinheimera oceanensis]|uniref:hypothetical protein n=1 Tax=Rheinheimera oceanensis TaxID=2817449 RepID=UPI001BFEE0CE|nr:hypothetical protein [Rheinheimera oceanensis]